MENLLQINLEPQFKIEHSRLRNIRKKKIRKKIEI